MYRPPPTQPPRGINSPRLLTFHEKNVEMHSPSLSDASRQIMPNSRFQAMLAFVNNPRTQLPLRRCKDGLSNVERNACMLDFAMRSWAGYAMESPMTDI